MSKTITDNQILGELGEAAAKAQFLRMGFQFDARSRLEAGIDAIVEIMDEGQPLAQMIAVQVKATKSGKYTSENEQGFTYLLRSEDLEYWRPSNLPVILVLYRQSDETFYWKEVPKEVGQEQRKLQFDKARDVLNHASKDRLAALTVPKSGHGYYVPPLGGGEEALVNMLPITLPSEMYVSTTPFTGKKATSILLDVDNRPRFDWVIKGNSYWSFHDPRESSTNEIVDADQVEAIDTDILAFHEDIDEQNTFAFLLKQTLAHQVSKDLRWDKQRKIFYFGAHEENQQRVFSYQSFKKKADTTVVNVAEHKKEIGSVAFVRHHAFAPRFECMLDQWYLIVCPTYHFTTNGFIPHSYPDALLSGKKRMDSNAALWGQVIMWHRFLSGAHGMHNDDLFSNGGAHSNYLTFGPPPTISLPKCVPEDAWGKPKSKPNTSDDQPELVFSEV